MNCDGGGAQRATSDCTLRSGARDNASASALAINSKPTRRGSQRTIGAIVGAAARVTPRHAPYNLRMAFVHLRTHTEYSVVDGTLRIDDAVRAARADHQVALAITDLGNLFGAVKFYRACRAAGVKPLIGVDLWLEPVNPADKQASRLLMLVCNGTGYLNLCQLLSRAWTSNTQRAQAWVKWDWLAECSDGLIALSGADAGAVGAALLAGDRERAAALAQRLAALYPGRFYL